MACFELNYNLYVLLVVSAVTFTIMVILLFPLWILRQQILTGSKHIKKTYGKENSNIEKRIMNLNDREEVSIHNI